MPAVTALLDGGGVKLDGFMLPGHVSVITGWREFMPLAEHYKLPCVVAALKMNRWSSRSRTLYAWCVTANRIDQSVPAGGQPGRQ